LLALFLVGLYLRHPTFSFFVFALKQVAPDFSSRSLGAVIYVFMLRSPKWALFLLGVWVFVVCSPVFPSSFLCVLLFATSTRSDTLIGIFLTTLLPGSDSLLLPCSPFILISSQRLRFYFFRVDSFVYIIVSLICLTPSPPLQARMGDPLPCLKHIFFPINSFLSFLPLPKAPLLLYVFSCLSQGPPTKSSVPLSWTPKFLRLLIPIFILLVPSSIR